MDTFCEQVVSRKNSVKQHIIFGVLCTVFALLEILFILLYLVSPSPFWIMMNLMVGLAAVCIIAVAAPRLYKVEYDYSVVSNNLYIDKVIAGKKRKSITKVEIGNVVDFARIENDNVPVSKYAKTYNCVKDGYEGNHYCVFNVANKGKCLLLFTPNEKIVDGMRPFMTREVVMKYFYGKK